MCGTLTVTAFAASLTRRSIGSLFGRRGRLLFGCARPAALGAMLVMGVALDDHFDRHSVRASGVHSHPAFLDAVADREVAIGLPLPAGRSPGRADPEFLATASHGGPVSAQADPELLATASHG